MALRNLKTRNVLGNNKNNDLKSLNSKVSEDEMPYSSNFSNNLESSARNNDNNGEYRKNILTRHNKGKNVVSTSLNPDRSASKSRLIIRGGSSESIRSSHQFPKTRKSYQHYTKLVISIKQDLDPNNILDKIETIDVELDKLEHNIPDGLDADDISEVEEMMKANKDLRQKVSEVSEMVKTTLVKVNKLRIKGNDK